MQSFTTEDYEFEINGETFALPELTIDGFERVAGIYKLTDPVEQLKAFRDALVFEADDKTAAAISKLSLRKVGLLFRGWTGVGGITPGESASSAE